jgi:hypothetical protein
VSITVTAAPVPLLEHGSLTVGGSYTTVNLSNSYINPVVVCSVQYANNSLPVVTRVNNVSSTSFDVRLQNPSGQAVATENVSYLVVEEGIWTIDGVKIEAQRYLSTVTDEDGSWLGEAQSYGQSYSNPVVLGQVMSENDADWSVFWSRGGSVNDPPSASVLYTGKTVCEDSDITRSDETIGFIVFEAGHGTLDGIEYEAYVGSDTVLGVDNSPPYTYSFNSAFTSAPQVALTSIGGMDGDNGGWAQVHGSTLATATTLYLSVDEDQIGDSERWHIDEQVSYVVFSPNTAPVNTAPVADDQSVSTPEDTAVAITLTASDAQGDPSMAPFSLTVKYQNGQFALLAEDSDPYVTGRNYQLEIVAQGSILQVYIDGSSVFTVNEYALAKHLQFLPDQGTVFGPHLRQLFGFVCKLVCKRHLLLAVSHYLAEA